MMPTEATAPHRPYPRHHAAQRRRRSRHTTLLLVLALAGAVPPIEAQETGPLQDLSRTGELRAGDRIYVTDADGKRRRGRLLDLTPTALTIATRDEDWTLPGSEVERIERRDSLLNGALIGAGVGLVLNCMPHPGCWGNPVAVGLHVAIDHGYPYFILAGAAVGALVDAGRLTTLYRASGTARVSVAPLVSPEGAGAGLTVKW